MSLMDFPRYKQSIHVTTLSAAVEGSMLGVYLHRRERTRGSPGTGFSRVHLSFSLADKFTVIQFTVI